jgi:hypothetical protein
MATYKSNAGNILQPGAQINRLSSFNTEGVYAWPGIEAFEMVGYVKISNLSADKASYKSFDITDKLESLFEDREDEVNALLLKAGRIQDGQTFRDLPDAVASKYISKPDLILSKLAVIVTPEIATTEVSNG